MFMPHGTERGQKILQRVWWLAAITLSFILLLCVNVTAGESQRLVSLRIQLPEEKSISHIRRFVLLHCQYDRVLLQELMFFIGKKKKKILLFCLRQMYAPPPPPCAGKAFVPVVLLRMTQGKLSLPFQYTLATTRPQTDERTVFLWGPFHL